MANHHTRVYDEVSEMLCGEENPTPLVRLRRVVPLVQAKVYAKLEWYNPFGSVNDRIAANMIRDARERGSCAKASNWSSRPAGTRVWAWR